MAFRNSECPINQEWINLAASKRKKEPAMQTVAILGAKGRLAHAAARAFLDADYRVIAVTRDGQLPKGLEGAEVRAADAMDRDAVIAATQGADVIFNGLNPPYTDWAEKCMPMARNVMAAAKAHGATHIFPGNVYNYGREIPPHADEYTPFRPSTRKGAIRIEMEALFEDEARNNGVQTIILRAGDFYGSAGTGSWFDLMIVSKLAKGVFTWPGAMDMPHAWAYLPDLAKAFVALADRREALNIFDTFTFEGHTMTGAEMKAHAEAATGRKLKRAGMPWIVIRAGGLFVPMWREIAEMSYLWFAPHALRGAKLQRVAGLLPSTPPAEAIRQAIADLAVPGRAKKAA
jgi:nucleoside-diphosphate-sugar epimerase